jgi:hypothetical protein
VVIVFFSLVAMFSMFEFLGREERMCDPEILRKIHRINGFLFILLFLYVAYLCIGYLKSTKVELSARAAIHSVLALTVAILLFVKVLFVRVYRKYYGQAKVLGLVIAILSLLMAGVSGGYYFVVGKPVTVKPKETVTKTVEEKVGFVLRTDHDSVERGKMLYEDKCSFCHDPYSYETLTGPGHKDILKNPTLPVSGRQATPENILRQLRNPFERMPSFAYLSGEELSAIVAFLNTL